MARAAGNRISFGDAQTVTRQRAGKKLREVAIAGLRDLRACKRMRAVILAVETDLDEKAKAAMVTEFVTKGCADRTRPDNFTGIDEDQQANCQLRARSFGAYGVDADTAEEIAQIGFGHLITTNETFQFNPEVLTDEVKTAIEKALSKVPGLPAGIIVKDVRQSLDTDAITKMFATKADDPEFIKLALPLLSSLAIRCDYNKEDADVAADAERIAKLLADPKFADLVKTAASDPERVLNPPREKKSRKA